MANRICSKDVSDNIIAASVMALSSMQNMSTKLLSYKDANNVTVGFTGCLIPIKMGDYWGLIDTATDVHKTTNIDTGSVAPSTKYYVYVVTNGTVVSFKTSTSASAPSGYTTANSCLLGNFTTDGSSNIGSTTVRDVKTEMTSNYFNSPTLVTPVLGTPASGDLQNCTASTTAAKGVVLLSGNTKALAGTDTASAMTPADVAAAQAIMARESDQGIAMTYAASGSNGIQVANDININPNTGDFTFVIKVNLPDWTPDVAWYTSKSTSAFAFQIGTDGKLNLILNSINHYTSTSPVLGGNTTHELVMVASRGNYINYFIDKILFEQVASTDTNDLTNTSNLIISGLASVRHASTVYHVYFFNRALTAAEVSDLYRNGIPTKWRKASQTALTSGTLVTGQEYKIDTFVAGDDFSNIATVVSGTINTTGCIFVATGTTPTTWTNSSSLRATGATLALEPEGVQPASANSQWLDSSSNKLNAILPAAGASNTRKIDSGRYVWSTAMTDDTTWTSILPAGFVLEKVIFSNSTANTCTLRLGTSAGGTEMAATISIAASTFTTATIDKVGSLTADTTLYLSDTGGGWGSCSLVATLFFRRFN